MEYISHEDFKNLMGKFQKGTPKGVLKEAVEEGNAFTAALAKTKKGEKAKVGGKEITDTSGYDNPSVKEYGYADQYPGAWPFRESHEGMDKWYEDFEDGLGNLVNNKYISKLEHGYYMKALDHIDPMDNYSEMNGHDAAKAFVDDLRTKSQMDADEEQWSREVGEGKLTEDIKVLKSISNREYKIKRPDGQVVDVYFDDVHVEEMIDAYGASGWISGEDNDGNGYVMSADLVDMGGGDWDIEPDYSTIEFHSAKSANEGLHMPPLQATGPTIDTVEEDIFKLPKRRDTSKLDYDPDASRFEPDYMKTPGEDDDDDDDDDNLEFDDEDISSSDDLPKHFRKTVAADKTRYPFLKENTVANPPFGFSVLSPDERKQLEEYITSIKTIKKEIVKLTAKAGKKVKEGDLGGNRTDLVMTPSVTSEADSNDKIEKIEDKIPEDVYVVSVKVMNHLRKTLHRAGFGEKEIMNFLQQYIQDKMKEKADKATTTPPTTSEADSHDKTKKIEDKIPEKLDNATVLAIQKLRKAGLDDGEIMMFLKHEMEEEAKKAIMSQHDF